MIDQAGIKMEHGRQIAAERVQGVNDNMVKSHYHEYFELYFLESGQRYHMVGDTLYYLHPGEFILFPPYIMHYSYGDSDIPFKRLVLYFTREMMAVPDSMDILGNHAHVYKADEKREIHTILQWILKNQESDDRYSEESMYLLLNHLIITLIRSSADVAKPEKETRINQIIRYLNENYTNPITLEDLSAHFYLSPYYLCREFKKHTNNTIVQYLNSLRVCHAQRLFQETDQSVTEISKIVGFSNVTHLNRIYKSITGQSPSQTRKLSAQRRAELTQRCQFMN